MDETSSGILSVEIWLREMQMLVKRCSHEASRFEDRVVRKAFHLAVLSPPPFRQMLNVRLTERELEMWLELGDIEHVARSIAGTPIQLTFLASSEEDRYRAALFDRANFAVNFEGASPALAIIGAWAHSLIRPQESKPSLLQKIQAPLRSIFRLPRSWAEAVHKRRYSM